MFIVEGVASLQLRDSYLNVTAVFISYLYLSRRFLKILLYTYVFLPVFNVGRFTENQFVTQWLAVCSILHGLRLICLKNDSERKINPDSHVPPLRTKCLPRRIFQRDFLFLVRWVRRKPWSIHVSNCIQFFSCNIFRSIQ